MSENFKIYLFSLLLLFMGGKAQADVIFADDFQDGKADRWQAIGKGDVRLSDYQKNISLQLSQSVGVVTAFSTTGYNKVSVSLSFAAKSLEKGEFCLGEVSGDEGQSWHQVNKVTDGQDDAVTLHRGSVSSVSLDDRNRVYLRVRVMGNRLNDKCWLDNVRVVGRTIQQAQQRGPFPFARLKTYDRPVAMAAFAPSAISVKPIYNFQGKLSFTGKIKGGGFEVLKDSHQYAGDKNSDVQGLPDFKFDFIQSGDELIPVRRGAIPNEHPMWEYILEPGKVWNEPGEEKFSRAAIPFALQEKNQNCTHNGVMTFLFNDDSLMSDVALQISSETCFYFKFDLWRYVAATYKAGPVEGGEKIIAAYAREKSARLPTKAIGDIAVDYPGIKAGNFGAAVEIDPEHMTAYGLIVDGVHYVGGCETRAGPYPYCDVLDLPSYSTAKSAFGGLALMRMEKLFPGVKDEKIADYIPACKKSGQWQEVTFLDALNMTTGNYATDKYMADEDGAQMMRFFNALTHKDKIDIACTSFRRKATPGSKWVYHTTDTYILGTALQNYLQQKQEGVDIYRDILADGVWKKMGLSPLMQHSRRTYDKSAQPFTGYGLTYHRDDIARIATLLQSDVQDIFDRTEFDKALQRAPQDRGIPAYGKDIYYKNGFWAKKFENIPGCKDPVWIPFMSGFGGISIVLIPNGMVYYYFSDNNEFSWTKAVLEAHRIKNICPR